MDERNVINIINTIAGTLLGGLLAVFLLGMFSTRAADKGLALVTHIDPRVPYRLVGDADLLRQVLINLLGNSVKFTANGRIWLEIIPAAKGHDRGRLLFRVHDTGIGISAEPPPEMRQITRSWGSAVSTISRIRLVPATPSGVGSFRPAGRAA